MILMFIFLNPDGAASENACSLKDKNPQSYIVSVMLADDLVRQAVGHRPSFTEISRYEHSNSWLIGLWADMKVSLDINKFTCI